MDEEDLTGAIAASMETYIFNLALRRQQLKALNAEIEGIEAMLRRDHADLYTARDYVRQLVEEADQQLRAVGQQAYENSGIKRLHPALSIRVMRKPVYDATKALDWARNAGIPDLIQLNKTEFEKLARITELPFVTIVEQPTAAVSQHLEVYLPAEAVSLDGLVAALNAAGALTVTTAAAPSSAGEVPF